MKILSKLRPKLAKVHSPFRTEKLLLVYVLLVLIHFKVLLILFPLKWFIRTLSGPASYQLNGVPHSTIEKRVWAVRVLSARVPLGFTCLVQALATKWLLKKQPGVRVHIGIRKNSIEGFSAHAWVTYQNETLLGAQPNLVFEPILTWS